MEECSVERAREKLVVVVVWEHVGGLVLVVCVSVMNVLCNGNKLNFKPRVLEERHLAPPLPSTGFNLFTAAESFCWTSDFRARSQQGQSVL